MTKDNNCGESCNCGVSCDVTNCVHHCSSNTCSAAVIHVGGSSADKADKTCCDTFSCKCE